MSRKALVLGTGLVSRPCVETLIKTGYNTTCASAIQEELDSLVQAYPFVKTVRLQVGLQENKDALKKLIFETDIVISLLPMHLHYEIALVCIETRKNLVTASYQDDAMENLHNRAVAAGITILSEAGLDPGIDHMIAMQSIDALREAGAQITEFRSLCGGIPAAECAMGPLKYKFSWYPKGMFLSAMKPAKCLMDGKVVEYGNILDHPETVGAPLQEYRLECLPNRDSLVYCDVYNIHSASTMFRGTLRYQGFSESLKALMAVGLTSQARLPELAMDASVITWREVMALLSGLPQESSPESVKQAVLEKLKNKPEQLKAILELGLISDKNVPKRSTPLDSLSNYLASALAYAPEEQDLVLMWVRLSGKLPSGQHRAYESTLVMKGSPSGGHSAMSRTVGVTVAACALLIDSGAVQQKGVILPTTKDIYEPVLARLSAEDITFATNVKDF